RTVVEDNDVVRIRHAGAAVTTGGVGPVQGVRPVARGRGYPVKRLRPEVPVPIVTEVHGRGIGVHGFAVIDERIRIANAKVGQGLGGTRVAEIPGRSAGAGRAK